MVSGPPWGSWSQPGTVSGTRYAPPRPLLPGSRPRVPTCTRAASSSARPTGWPRCEPSTRQSAHTQRRQRRPKSSATGSPCSGLRQPRASSGYAGPSPPGVPLGAAAPAIHPQVLGTPRREGPAGKSKPGRWGGALRAVPLPAGKDRHMAGRPRQARAQLQHHHPADSTVLSRPSARAVNAQACSPGSVSSPEAATAQMGAHFEWAN